MNLQSLQDPHAKKPVADPLAALWAKYQRLDAAEKVACDAYSKAEGEYFDSHPSGSLNARENKKARAKAGLSALEKASATTSNRADAVLKRIMTSPATSLDGLLIKLRAVAEWSRHEPSDPVIEGVKTAIEALERLAQPTSPDPLVALWSKWTELRNTRTPEGVDFEGEERFNEDLSDRMMALEFQIIEARAETLTGALVQLAIASYYAEQGTPHDAKPLLADLGKSAERVLLGVAAAQGGAS